MNESNILIAALSFLVIPVLYLLYCIVTSNAFKNFTISSAYICGTLVGIILTGYSIGELKSHHDFKQSRDSSEIVSLVSLVVNPPKNELVSLVQAPQTRDERTVRYQLATTALSTGVFISIVFSVLLLRRLDS